MMRTAFAIMILLFQVKGTPVNAQSAKVWSAGDKLPDFKISNLMNHGTETMKLSDFRGKLLILEFWNTSCIACVESWPKLVKLQAKFKDRVQIVLINPEQDKQVIESMVKRREKALSYRMDLPIACRDSVMGQLFQPSYYPYIVWIDREGFFRGSGYGSSTLNEASIGEMLEDDVTSKISQEVRFSQTADPALPLFKNGNAGGGDELTFQTVFATHIDGLYPSWNIVPGEESSTCTITNSSILDILRFLYGGLNNRFGVMTRVPLNRIELIGEDTARLLPYVDDNVRLENIHSYQTFSKRRLTREELKQQCLYDVERYFDVKAHWEKKIRPCLVFKMVDSTLATYKDGPVKLLTTDVNFRMNKCTVTEMIQDMEGISNYYYSPYPIVDETDFNGLIGGIEIETNVYDHVALDKALQKYGIRFAIELRELDILVIRSNRSE